MAPITVIVFFTKLQKNRQDSSPVSSHAGQLTSNCMSHIGLWKGYGLCCDHELLKEGGAEDGGRGEHTRLGTLTPVSLCSGKNPYLTKFSSKPQYIYIYLQFNIFIYDNIIYFL